MRPIRLFVAVDLESDVLAGVERVISVEKEQAPQARWVSREKWHVTLVFLGEIAADKLEQVRSVMMSVASQHSPFVITVSKAGCFPSPRCPRVLWLGLGGDLTALGALRSALEEAFAMLGHTVDGRDYQPHLTVVRAARGADPALGPVAARLAAVDLGASNIRELVLYQSELSRQGSRYTALLRAPLEGSSVRASKVI